MWASAKLRRWGSTAEPPGHVRMHARENGGMEVMLGGGGGADAGEALRLWSSTEHGGGATALVVGAQGGNGIDGTDGRREAYEGLGPVRWWASRTHARETGDSEALWVRRSECEVKPRVG